MSEPDNPRSSVSSTSTSLIEGVQAHDPTAWERLVRLYGPLVDYWIRRAGSLQPSDVDDVFQEVFHAVARSIGQFRRDRPTDTFRGWLRVITRSKLADLQRRRSHEPPATGGSDARRWFEELAESPHDESEELKEATDLRRRVVEIVRAEFEERTWQAFWRVTVEGQAVKEVAHDLRVTPAAIRLAKSRVLRRLRDEMRTLEP